MPWWSPIRMLRNHWFGILIRLTDMRRSNHVRYFAYVLGLFATPGLSEPTRAAGVQSLHALDVFGASRSIRNCWVRRGFRSESLDFLIGGADHDILTQRGWYLYLDHLLQMKLDSQYPLGFYVMICVVMTLGSSWELWFNWFNLIHIHVSSQNSIQSTPGSPCLRTSWGFLRLSMRECSSTNGPKNPCWAQGEPWSSGLRATVQPICLDFCWYALPTRPAVWLWHFWQHKIAQRSDG